MSMKVERSTLDQVQKRFEMNKKKREEKKKQYDFEERMKELKEDVRICCVQCIYLNDNWIIMFLTFTGGSFNV